MNPLYGALGLQCNAIRLFCFYEVGKIVRNNQGSVGKFSRELGFLHEVGKFSVLGEKTLNRRSSSRMQEASQIICFFIAMTATPNKEHKLDPEKHKSTVREKSPNMF